MAAAAADRALSGALASTSSAADRVAAFKRRFPCREQQIDLLADELTRRGSAGASSCLVYGPRHYLLAMRVCHALGLSTEQVGGDGGCTCGGVIMVS